MPETPDESTAADAEIETLCDTFEQAWKAGAAPSIKSYLPPKSAPHRRPALMEMILVDQWYRKSENQSSTLQFYLAEFPELEPSESLPADFLKYFSEESQGAEEAGPHTNATIAGGPPKNSANKLKPDNDKSNHATVVGAHQPATQESLQTPRKIGRYEVKKILGRGAFGEVYQAHDGQLDRLVAIKVPRMSRLKSSAALQTYLNEARALAKMDHPAIIPIYDVGTTSEYPCYVVSKLVEGTDLQVLQQAETVPVEQVVKIVSRIADALHYAHKKGLVHRDVKPANILVDQQGEAYLADFGIALKDDDIGEGPEYVGTPIYMSPEQVSGTSHRLDGRSDIFSLGVVLYELLTGRRPFRSDSDIELKEQISSMEAKPLRQINDSIPEGLERICRKALAKSVNDRYSTAADFARDLRKQSSATATDSGTHNNASAIVLAIGLALVLLPLAALGFNYLWKSSTESAETTAVAPDSDAPPQKTNDTIPDKTDPVKQANTSAVDQVGQIKDPANVLKSFAITVSRDKQSFKPIKELLPLQNGDMLHFSIRLNEPAYVRLLWIDSAGEPAEVYPEDPEIGNRGNDPVVKLESPVQVDRGWPLQGKDGTETALLLVGSQPLTQIALEEFRTGIPVGTSGQSLARYVATQDQNPIVKPEAGVASGSRSLGHSTQRVDDGVLNMLERIRNRVDLTEAIAIPHRKAE